MARKIKFEKGKIYHIFNRGVDKRDIFLDYDDHFRFVYDLFEFNDEGLSTSLALRSVKLKQDGKRGSEASNGGSASFKHGSEAPIGSFASMLLFNRPRDLIVEILAFVLMRNHYHLLLREIKEGKISEFMHKLGTGYTNYFNEKYERTGSLFQGTFKAVEIESDSQLRWTLFYIHFNPIEKIEPKWKEKKIFDKKKVLDFLNSYRWSSHLDYLGKINFPQVTQRDLLINEFKELGGYEKEFKEWIDEFDMSKYKFPIPE